MARKPVGPEAGIGPCPRRSAASRIGLCVDIDAAGCAIVLRPMLDQPVASARDQGAGS